MSGERGHEGFSKPAPPVREGDEVEVKIEGMGSSGDGLARVRGFVVFVPGTRLNETVRVKITKVARNVAFAEKL